MKIFRVRYFKWCMAHSDPWDGEHSGARPTKIIFVPHKLCRTFLLTAWS